MDKLIKIVLMAFIGVVLPCLSFAYPDTYYYDNFLLGSSPYIVDTSNFALDSNGLWEKYLPALADTTESTIKNGLVVTFSDTFMGGTIPPTAVPSVNMSTIGSGLVELLPNCAVVVYCDGDMNNYYVKSASTGYGVGISGIPLGFTTPCNYNIDSYGTLAAVNNFKTMNCFLNSSGTNFYSFRNDLNRASNFSSSSIFVSNSAGFPATMSLLEGSSFNSPYASCASVYLLVNTSSETVYVYSLKGNGPVIDINDVYYNGIKWFALSYGNSANGNFNAVENGRRTFLFPHIQGNLDIYSPLYEETISGTYFNVSYIYDISMTLNFSTSGLVKFQGVSSLVNLCFFHTYEIIDLETMSDSYIPIFLTSAVKYLSSTAIHVKDGYISILNYDELIAKLKEAGVGSSDMSEVVRILDEINSGGATGEEVKELIGILEEYHDQLMANGDFGSVTSVFDTYKNLLDFTDDMHWLITANNALFSYFAGFLMLCVLFLAINRVMR